MNWKFDVFLWPYYLSVSTRSHNYSLTTPNKTTTKKSIKTETDRVYRSSQVDRSYFRVHVIVVDTLVLKLQLWWPVVNFLVSLFSWIESESKVVLRWKWLWLNMFNSCAWRYSCKAMSIAIKWWAIRKKWITWKSQRVQQAVFTCIQIT